MLVALSMCYVNMYQHVHSIFTLNCITHLVIYVYSLVSLVALALDIETHYTNRHTLHTYNCDAQLSFIDVSCSCL